MNKVLKNYVIIGILILILSPVSAIATPQNTINKQIQSPTERFSSYIHLNCDATALNQELPIDQTVSVPLTISYMTDIPSHFLRFFPWQIRNYILFGSVIGPMQDISLEIINEPSWADITLSMDAVSVNIPFYGVKEILQTSILISLYSTAPACPYTFKVKASCESIGLLSGCESTISITFTTGWVPRIEISAENPIITAPAGSLVNAKINITNTGNSESLVIGTIHSGSFMDGWGLCLEPSYLLIRQDETKHITFHIGIPSDCTNCMNSIQLDFIAMSPYHRDITAGPYSLYFRVHGVKP